jgi:hypothetical protein
MSSALQEHHLHAMQKFMNASGTLDTKLLQSHSDKRMTFWVYQSKHVLNYFRFVDENPL